MRICPNAFVACDVFDDAFNAPFEGPPLYIWW